MRIILAIVLGLALLCGVLAPVAAQGVWPGEALLWRGDIAVTQTVQYRSLNVNGANYVYLFYDTGNGSASATANITITRQWRGVTFQTLTASGSVGTSQRATGVVTIAAASPYYPDVLVQVSVTAGTITPTVAVVGQ